MNTNSKIAHRLGKRCFFVASCVAFLTGARSFAHNGVHHGKESLKDVPPDDKAIFAKIDSDYAERVKPIFQRSCFDCHSSNPNLPWYFPLPGARQLIESDMQEAKVHLDMTKGFPFAGHGTPLEDIDAIGEALSKDSMPPLRYRFMHSSAKVSETERNTIREWLERSKAALAKPGKEKQEH